MCDLDREFRKVDVLSKHHERLCMIRQSQILTNRDYAWAYLLSLLATAIYSKMDRPPSSQLLLDDWVILTAIVISAEYLQKVKP